MHYNKLVQSQLYLFFNLFIKALQHKCWRSVGHQVLQPAKDVELGQYVWKVADRRKNPWCTSWTCSHPIYARTLTGVCQAIRIFFSCFFHIFLDSFVWLIYFPYLVDGAFEKKVVWQWKMWPDFGKSVLMSHWNTYKITQFIVTKAKDLQNFLKYFQLFSGNSRWELHIVTTFKLIGSARSSFWL